MFFQKSMDCVSSKCQIPAMPRVPRSAKRRRSSRKRIVSKNQMCAIDLLATLAGKLLEERSEFWDPSKMPGKSTRESESPVKDGSFCHGSCDESTVAPLQVIPQTSGSLIYDDTTNACALKDPTNLDRRPQVIVSSDSSVEFPLYRDCQKVLNSSFSIITEGMPGENSSESTHPEHTHHPKAFKACCLEHNRKRKAIKSSCRKTDPVSYNCRGMTNDDVQMKPVFQNPKLFYTRQRSQRSPFKKRKLFGSCLVSQFCGSSRDNDFKDLAVKDVNRLDAAESDSIKALNRANVMSCSSNDQNSTFESEGHPVKLSIKSFKVPELSIEIPANSTVGSLKRAVSEAVMSILGDGLCVGVLLQGNKVGDDDKSLRQAGIFYENKMDGLGFTLEPNPTKAPKHRCSLKKPDFMACDPEPLNMFQANPIPISGTNSTESDRENSVDSNCKALVMVSAADQSKPLSVILMGRSRPSDFSQQRRIRRPFSVSEVEALVQAVEKLGTGRWRDVKLRSFGNSKHRTYVDLKDKWKTLVHTARISPQQRRGEPVPQKLLDRVLSAHAFWSQPGPDHAPLLLQK